MERIKTDAQILLALPSFGWGVASGTGDDVAFLVLGKIDQAKGVFLWTSHGRSHKVNIHFPGFFMVLVASVEGISQHLFRPKAPIVCRFQGGDQSMHIAFVSGLDFNMGDQVQSLFPFVSSFTIAVGLHHLNLVALALMRRITRIRVRGVLKGG